MTMAKITCYLACARRRSESCRTQSSITAIFLLTVYRTDPFGAHICRPERVYKSKRGVCVWKGLGIAQGSEGERFVICRFIPPAQVATVQSISGTGALRVGAEFVRANLARPAIAYLPDPTYVNHIPVRSPLSIALMRRCRSFSFQGLNCVAIAIMIRRQKGSTSRVL